MFIVIVKGVKNPVFMRVCGFFLVGKRQCFGHKMIVFGRKRIGKRSKKDSDSVKKKQYLVEK